MSIILSEGEEKSSINLETSEGNEINNYQVFSLSAFERNSFKDYSKENYPTVKFRNSPSPIYNCHGMSFASKRTNIDKAQEIKKILEEDNYKQVDQKSTLPGDIVLYIDPDDGDIVHSGTVTSCIDDDKDLQYILVVSKWGKFKEVVHNLYQTPYKECIHKFFRVDYEEFQD